MIIELKDEAFSPRGIYRVRKNYVSGSNPYYEIVVYYTEVSTPIRVRYEMSNVDVMLDDYGNFIDKIGEYNKLYKGGCTVGKREY